MNLDFFLKEKYPCCIIRTRYGGTYEDAPWVAFADEFMSLGDVDGGDYECQTFFMEYKHPIGRGDTPQKAFDNLVKLCEEKKRERERLSQ